MRLPDLILALALLFSGLVMLYRAVQPGHIPTPNFSFGPSVSAVNWLWEDIDAPPDANATGHLIFDTVNSFLQHWPNTRYRNGMLFSCFSHSC
jgi:hypothetical protein